MKYFFNRTEEAQTIDLIQSHAIDASTLEMDAFRKAATGVEQLRRQLNIAPRDMDRYIADLRTDLKLSETPLKGEQKMQVMMAGTAYTTARDRLYQKLGKSFHENDFACDADPQRLHSNLLQEVPSGCATSYMVIRSLMNSIRMHAIESLDKPGAPRLGEGQGR